MPHGQPAKGSKTGHTHQGHKEAQEGAQAKTNQRQGQGVGQALQDTGNRLDGQFGIENSLPVDAHSLSFTV